MPLQKGNKRIRWKTKVISARISPRMMEAVMEVVESGRYVDVTDYVRDIVRSDLEARGISLEPGAGAEQPD